MPQPELVRCTLGPSGPVVGRTAPGRGAWVCSAACLRTAIARKGFERAWRRSVPADQLVALQIAFEGVITEVKELPTAGASPSTVPMKG
jgi:predicted RNA-binding protein YlxR (DUF448 family)